MEVLKKNGDGSYNTTWKAITSLIGIIIVVIAGVNFASTNRADISSNSNDIMELKENTISKELYKSEYDNVIDKLDEITYEIKELRKEVKKND